MGPTTLVSFLRWRTIWACPDDYAGNSRDVCTIHTKPDLVMLKPCQEISLIELLSIRKRSHACTSTRWIWAYDYRQKRKSSGNKGTFARKQLNKALRIILGWDQGRDNHWQRHHCTGSIRPQFSLRPVGKDLSKTGMIHYVLLTIWGHYQKFAFRYAEDLRKWNHISSPYFCWNWDDEVWGMRGKCKCMEYW